jgi:hypothetical protein
LVISQVLRFFRLKPGFSLAKPRFLAEVVQKLKFQNNSIQKFQVFISHNVPAVYDILPDANKGLAKHRFRRKRDQGWQNVPEQRRGNGA